MLARLTKIKDEGDGGFTLPEILVVLIIIGILAAIAIPVFLNQRRKGYDAGVKSDLRNAATAQETYLVDYAAYSTTAANLASVGFNFSTAADYTGNTRAIHIIVTGASASYCMDATSASGKLWVVDNSKGGLQPAGTAVCT
jgi:type IV pilus assembly protein PilA